jgi:hypothetical protein
MFATIVGNRVHVRLSRRNLRQLDAVLDDPAIRNRWLARRAENGVSLVVEVEDDADHYERRDPGPGLRPGEAAHQRRAANHSIIGCGSCMV